MAANYDIEVRYRSGDMAGKVKADAAAFRDLGASADKAQKAVGSVARSYQSSNADKAARSNDRVAGSFGSVAKSADRAASSADRAGSKVARSGADASKAAGGWDRAKNAVLGFVLAFGALSQAQAAVGSFNQFEAITRTLNVATGSVAAGADAFKFLREESERLGLVLPDVATEYGKLSAATMGSNVLSAATQDIFLGVAEAGAALGLSVDQQAGALTAFTQIASKGKVMAEELRGQIGERIPGAFSIAARAMNVTEAELNDLLQTGQVTAEQFLPAFAAELRKTFGPGAADGANSLRADLNRLQTAAFDLQVAFASGLAPGLQDAVKEMRLASDGSKQVARDFGTVLGGAVQILGNALAWLGDNWSDMRAAAATAQAVLVEGVGRAFAAVVRIIGNFTDALTDSLVVMAKIASVVDPAGLATKALQEMADWASANKGRFGEMADTIAASSMEAADALTDVAAEQRKLDQDSRKAATGVHKTAAALDDLRSAGGSVKIDISGAMESILKQQELLKEETRLWVQLGVTREEAAQIAAATMKFAAEVTKDFTEEEKKAGKGAEEIAAGVLKIEKAALEAFGKVRQARTEIQALAEIPDLEIDIRIDETAIPDLTVRADVIIDSFVDETGQTVNITAALGDMDLGGLGDFDPSIFFPPDEALSAWGELGKGVSAASVMGEGLGQVLMGVADVIWETNKGLGQFVGRLGNLIQVMNDPNATKAQKSQAAAGVTASAAGVLLGGGERRSEFGGMNSNYAAEGAEIGSMFGVWGAIVGGIIGAMIDNVEKAVIELKAGGRAVVTKADEGLKEFANDFASEMQVFIDGFEKTLGVDLANVDTKIQIKGDVIEVTVGDVTAGFTSMAGAMAFLQERLVIANREMGTFTEGLGENVSRLINNLSTRVSRGDAGDFREAITLASDADRLKTQGIAPGDTGAAAQIYEQAAAIMKQFQRDLELATQYGLNFADVIALTDAALNNLKGQVEKAFASFLGATDFAGQVKDLVAQMTAANSAITGAGAERLAIAAKTEAEIAKLEADLARARTEAGNRTITAVDGTTRTMQRFNEGLSDVRTDLRNSGERIGLSTTGMAEAFTRNANAADAFAGAFTGAIDRAFEPGKSIQDLEFALKTAKEKAEALRLSLEGLPDAFSAADIMRVFETGAMKAFDQIASTLGQIQGLQIDEGELKKIQTFLAIQTLKAQLQGMKTLMKATGDWTEAMERSFGYWTGLANRAIAGLESGDFTIGGGGGGGKRKAALEELARLEEQAATSTNVLNSALGNFREVLDLMGRLKDPEQRARALAAGMTIFSRALDEILKNAKTLPQLGDLFADVTAQLAAPDLPPALRATLEEYLGKVTDQIGEVAKIALDDLVLSIADMVKEGDVEGVQKAFEKLQAEFLALPESVRAGMGDFAADLERELQEALRAATLAAVQGAQSAVEGLTIGGGIRQAYAEFVAQIAASRAVIEQATLSDEERAAALAAIDANAAQAVFEYGAQLAGQFVGGLTSLAGQYGVEVDAEKLIGLRKLEFQLAIFQLEAQIALLLQMGVITEEQAAGFAGTLDDITRAAEDADWSPITEGIENAVAGALESIADMTARGGVMKSFADLTKQIAAQRKEIDKAAKSEAERTAALAEFDATAGQVIAEFGAQLAGQLNSAISGMASTFGVELAPEELFELRKLEFDLQMATIRAQVDLLVLTGAVSQEVADGYGLILDKIQKAAEGSLYLPIENLDLGDSGGYSTGGVDPEADLAAIIKAIDDWERAIEGISNPLKEQALEIEAKRADFEESLRALYVYPSEAVAEQLARIEVLANRASKAFVDSVLKPFEEIDTPIGKTLEQFDQMREAFEALENLSPEEMADAMARLAVAQAKALDDIFAEMTSGLRGFLDELTAEDPRRTNEEMFTSAQDRFRDLAERARAGDTEALAQLEAAGREFLEQSQAFLGEGPGSLAARDEIMNTISEILGAGIDPFLPGAEPTPGETDIIEELELSRLETGDKVDRTNSILADIRTLLGGRPDMPSPPIYAPQEPQIFAESRTREEIARAVVASANVNAGGKSAAAAQQESEAVAMLARELERAREDAKKASAEHREFMANALRIIAGQQAEQIREAKATTRATLQVERATSKRSGAAGGVAPSG